MSESTEGSQSPVVPVVSTLGGTTIRAAAAPPGTLFALGWLLAGLFDPRRRASVSVRQPPFNPNVQLPQVSDLLPDPKLAFLAAELTELVTWYPVLAGKTAKITAETGKLRATVDPQAGEGAGAAAPGAGGVAQSADEVPFAETTFLTAVRALNQAILDEFASDAERLSAYQLGLALSDLTWLPAVMAPGQPIPAAGKPSALSGLFSRPQMAAVKTLLSGAGAQLPGSAAAIVGGSLDHWADWLDVHMADITTGGADAWSAKAGVVLDALRVQGWIWRSVLIADPEVSVAPSMSAWVQAASSITRAARLMSGVILRRFWPLALTLLATLGGLLYLVIANLSGVSQVWASLVTVLAVLSAGGAGLGGGVSRSFGGVGYEIWDAAKLDASVWTVTWLPALATSAMQQTRLDSRGVGAPQIRKNLDPS